MWKQTLGGRMICLRLHNKLVAVEGVGGIVWPNDQKMGLGIVRTWVWILASLFTSCETWGITISLNVFICKMGYIIFTEKDCCKDLMMHVKCLLCVLCLHTESAQCILTSSAGSESKLPPSPPTLSVVLFGHSTLTWHSFYLEGRPSPLELFYTNHSRFTHPCW